MSAFGLTPPPPLGADVLHEWSLRAALIVTNSQYTQLPQRGFETSVSQNSV